MLKYAEAVIFTCNVPGMTIRPHRSWFIQMAGGTVSVSVSLLGPIADSTPNYRVRVQRVEGLRTYLVDAHPLFQAIPSIKYVLWRMHMTPYKEIVPLGGTLKLEVLKGELKHAN